HGIIKLDLSEKIFPGEEEEEDLFSQFSEELKNVDEKVDPVTIYYLLKKYAFFIPYSDDISLFMHMKLTSAVASCIEKNEEKPFLFVLGDFSGIQKFIYDVASPDEARPGMAKRLRGRSLWLDLFMDAVVSDIIREAGVSEANVLWNTGGNFLLLIPNLKENRDKIEEIRRNVNEGLFKKFKGEIFLAIDFAESSSLDFPEVMRNLSFKTGLQKRQKFIDCIEFEFGGGGEIEKHCIVCGIGEAKKEGKCGFCELNEKIGGKVATADYIVKGFDGGDLNFKEFGLDACYDFLTKEELEKLSTDVIVYRLNSVDFLLNSRSAGFKFIRSAGFKFIGSTVPLHEIVLSFDQIAQFGRGASKIGVLKADVDNLGKIFKFGSPEERRTISRICMLSSMLDLFFLGYINRICEKFHLYKKLCSKCEEKAEKIEVETELGRMSLYRLKDACKECSENRIPTIYINYSGGDDLLIFGPYDDIIELSGEIRDCFKKFVCFNKDIEISAGIAVVDEKLPVARSVAIANDELRKSKSYAGKARVTILGETLKWESYSEKGFKEAMELAKKMEEDVGIKISKSFVFSLLHLWNRYFSDVDEVRKEDAVKIKMNRRGYMPYLVWLIGRNIKERKDKEEYFESLRDFIPWIRLPVYWVSLRLRGR
ncbi:MAG TPA: type III-A CRISPR-associated protein Cas10/Csm1, partial [Thermoplasmata archaeon]|nr:type III-A CRISPR-associated protein Cas10/Csm1 [Thermoplasmata archaeon]